MTDTTTPSPAFRRIGRTLVFTTFAILGVYILGVTLTSVFLALYGKPPTLQDGDFTVAQRSYCVRTLVGLRDELEQEVTNVAQPPKPRVDAQLRWRAWDATFHERMGEARSRCTQDEGIEHAYENLAQMYKGYSAAATHIIDVRTTVAPAVADVVNLLRSPSTDAQ